MSFRRRPWLLSVAFFLLLAAVNAALQPSFVQPGVMVSNLSTFLPLILVAMGQTYVVLNGDIDLSIGAVVSVVNVVTVRVIGLGGDGLDGILSGMAAGLGAGIACGLVNGACVAWLRFQPIVTTFASGIAFAGLALWVLPEASGAQVPEVFWRTYAAAPGGVPFVVWVLAAAILLGAVLARTRFYVTMLAVGGHRQGAYQSGLPVNGTRVRAYVLSGVFAAFAAFCLTGETATGDPLIGNAFTLSSVSAVVLGGTALSGGVGGVIGSLFGAAILGLINNVVFFARLPFEWQGLMQGLIILAALAGGVLVSRRQG